MFCIATGRRNSVLIRSMLCIATGCRSVLIRGIATGRRNIALITGHTTKSVLIIEILAVRTAH